MRRFVAVLAVFAIAATGCAQDETSSSPASTPTASTSSASPAAASPTAASSAAAAIDTSINEKPVDGSDPAAVKTVDVKAQPAAQLPAAASGYYKLKTVFRGEDECLEGNRLAPESVLKGAAFMDKCQNVTGQLWYVTAIPA